MMITMLVLLPLVITQCALLFYVWLILRVGFYRGKHHLAPGEVGNASFERLCRVQVNTAEQLILFIPSLWMFSLSVSLLWGAVLGCLWLVGRAVYLRGYMVSFEKRKLGFMMTLLPSLTMLVGGLIGSIFLLVPA